MTGATLKHKLLSMDQSLANVARRLDVTPQTLDAALKVQDVKTGYIEKIAKAYHVPISEFFEEEQRGNVFHANGNHNIQAQKIDTVDQRTIHPAAPSAAAMGELEQLRLENSRLKSDLLSAQSRLIDLLSAQSPK